MSRRADIINLYSCLKQLSATEGEKNKIILKKGEANNDNKSTMILDKSISPSLKKK